MELKGNEYQIGSLNAFDHLHVVRKLAPALPLVEGLVAERNAGKDMTMLTVFVISKLSDEDSDYVISKCLSAVSRKQSSGYAKLMANGALMFNDLDVTDMLKLTAQVIVENLGDFFRTALSTLDGGAEESQ